MPTPPSRHLLTRARRGLGALLAILIVLGLAPSAPAQAEGRPRALRQLVQESAAQPERTFRVIVGRVGRGAAADGYLASRGSRKLKDVGRGVFVAEVKGKEIAALARHPGVRWVTIDAPIVMTALTPTAVPTTSPTAVPITSPTVVPPASPTAFPPASPTVVPTVTPTVPGSVDGSRLGTFYNQTLNVTPLWAQGITGQGVGIAVIDTGIDDSSLDFRGSSGASRVVATVNTTSSPATVRDGYGHGSHVAGIAAGNSWSQPNGAPTRGKYAGVAPGASLISVRVADDQGRTYLSDVMEGIDWVIANRQIYNIRVLNLSLTSTVAESASTSYLAAAVERAWMNGILVVVAAGNAGPNTALYPPANDPFVVTVGASDPGGTPGRSDDSIATWSSYGLTQDGYSKPDVVAPGRYITSNLAAGRSVLGDQFSDRIVDGTYLWLSGTSMAAPQIAGAAALAFQRNPALTNNGYKWLLMNTADRLGPASAPLAGQGAGLVDAKAAAMHGGTPGVANSGLRINAHLVGPNGATVYAGSSQSGATWTEGGWDSAAWTEGGWDSAAWTEGGWDATTYTARTVE